MAVRGGTLHISVKKADPKRPMAEKERKGRYAKRIFLFLVERPQPTVNTPHSGKPYSQSVPQSRPAEYRQW